MRNMMRRWMLGLVGVLACPAAWADVKLPAIISDNMVLQRSTGTPVWGTADPGEQVTVSLAGVEARATADDRGHWRVDLPLADVRPAGAVNMVISGKNQITIKNILIGEVWLGSGQSNMEFPVRATNNAEQEMAAADLPEIRLYTVPKAIVLSPGGQPTLTRNDPTAGKWLVCSPQTIGDFSGVAFYFGRELHRELSVPVGLIDCSWSGSAAEPWTSIAAMEGKEELDAIVKRFVPSREEYERREREYEQKMAEWEKAHPVPEVPNTGKDNRWHEPDFDDSGWKVMKLPTTWERTGLQLDGTVWFRRTFDVPAEWEGKDLELSLGPVDDFDTTYVNGVEIGATGPGVVAAWRKDRVYRIPASAVKAGANTLAVRVLDWVGGGGITGPATKMKVTVLDGEDATAVSLSGDWKYEIEQEIEPITASELRTRPSLPMAIDNFQMPSGLFNGMVLPNIPFGIRGVIWYQGETNTARAYQYRTLLRALIADWRKHWEIGDFPFLIVQLAGFQQEPTEPGEFGWAEFRESQALVAQDPGNGLAVTIDLGDALDVHPRNKQDVGRRLALVALARTYGKDVEYSGPVLKDMQIEGSRVQLTFDHAEGGLVIKGDKVTGFAIAGEDRKFVWADAAVEGNVVELHAPGVEKPVAVRYLWSNTPEVTLYNRVGLPMGPFRTDDWPGITFNNR